MPSLCIRTLLLTASLCIFTTSTASAASWTVQTTPEPSAGQKRLRSVSCPSSTACEAIGNTEGEKSWGDGWNGTTWTIQTVPSPSKEFARLFAVSCTAASECTAAGKSEGQADQKSLAERWNGTSWTIQTTASPKSILLDRFGAGVSCPSSTACTSVGEYENEIGLDVTLAERWTGTTWSKQTTVNSKEKEVQNALESVSCPSTTACMAVGIEWDALTFGDKPFAESWNGTSWTATKTPPADFALTSVSCTASNACSAIGGSEKEPAVDRWNGTEWSEQKLTKPEKAKEYEISSISCTEAKACTAVGDESREVAKEKFEEILFAENWNGTSWTVVSVPSPAEAVELGLSSVSCKTSTECMAVGFYWTKSAEHTLIERYH